MMCEQREESNIERVGKFPPTRYRGSKSKLVDWIWAQLAPLEFETALDVFGGTGAVSYRLKQEGRCVTYNDGLQFNAWIGKALIENEHHTLGEDTIEWVLQRHSDVEYDDIIQRHFVDINFTQEENGWLDQTIANLHHLDKPYPFCLAFFALCQACLIKRPFNLFHRKNLYLREADVQRSFGNKASWDRPFPDYFRDFARQANEAVFSNTQPNKALHLDAFALPDEYDLVYIDPPYLSKKGDGVDYHGFYHFLEGLTMYKEWPAHIDHLSKHRRLKRRPNPWQKKATILSAFEQLFERHKESIIALSYRDDGYPSIEELQGLLKKTRRHVKRIDYGHYQYALSTNAGSQEVLLIATH